MNTEADFLAALGATPGDDLLRSAYADFLEERGDPRAAWMRDELVHPWMYPDWLDPRPRLAEALQSASRSWRRTARRALRHLGGDAVPTLLGLLGHPDDAVRVQAAECLTDPDSAGVLVPALVRLLADPVGTVRAAASRTLDRAFPLSPIDPAALRAAVADGDREVRRNARRMLRRMGTLVRPEAALVEALSSPDARRRVEAIRGLVQVGTRPARDAVAAAFADDDADVRAEAVEAHLRLHRNLPAVTSVAALAGDESVRVRLAVTRALGFHAPAGADIEPTLLRLTADPVPLVARDACRGLGRREIRREAFASLIALTAHPEATVREAAADALWTARVVADGEPPRVPSDALETLAADPVTAVTAVRLMGRYGDPAFVATAIAAHGRAREGSATGHLVRDALVEYAPAAPETIDVLRAALRGGDVLATRLLGKIGPPASAAVPDLLAAVRSLGVLTTDAAAAILDIGDPTGLEGLRDVVRSSYHLALVLAGRERLGARAADLLPAVLDRLDDEPNGGVRAFLIGVAADLAPVGPEFVSVLLRELERPPTDANEHAWCAACRVLSASPPAEREISRLLQLRLDSPRPGRRFGAYVRLVAALLPLAADAAGPLHQALARACEGEVTELTGVHEAAGALASLGKTARVLNPEAARFVRKYGSWLAGFGRDLRDLLGVGD